MKKLRHLVNVQGNGTIISKEFAVSSFVQLHLSIRHDIELYHSNEEKVVIEMDENLQEFVDVSNSGSTLYVSTDTGILKKALFTTCKVKVYYRQLHVIHITTEGANFDCKQLLDLPNDLEVNIQSVGNTTLRLNAPGIKLISKCVGDVTVEGKCNLFEVKNNSVGNLNTKDLIAGEVIIKNKGVGEVLVYAADAITINHGGVGNLFYYGSATLKELKHNGGGLVQHKEL
jgi:hypothetical protein